MPNSVGRMADSLGAAAPAGGAGIGRMPWHPRPGSRSLFAMAAWERMAMGSVALLLLWLLILWATAA